MKQIEIHIWKILMKQISQNKNKIIMSTVKNNTQLSFWHLISNISKIEIPIIQRDYAQGRDNDKTNKIRYRFLRSLINAIDNNVALELDFVYGNIENDIFQPLDGQQRLTTLFLLHWFIAQKMGTLSEVRSQLIKFTYETRISSREFCNELVNKGDNLGKGESISEQLKDSTWFFLSWGNDPTIKAMLIMLNDIEEQLYGKNLTELWAKLISMNPPITFYFKELKDIGLTDDLYIKMNARGKELTNFEHFKALFEKYIEKQKWEMGITNPRLTFSHKIDTTWTDLFWKHRGNDNLVDNEFVNFISGIAINYYAKNIDIQENNDQELIIRKELEEKAKGKSVTNEAVKRERVERKIADLFKSANKIVPSDFYSKKAFDYLIQCFEIYSKHNNDLLLPDKLLLWDFCKSRKVKINNNTEVDNTLFVEFIKDTESTYKQRVLFYAQTQFLLSTKDFVSESFSDWMRVVRNIVQNSTIDSAATFIGAVGLISEISEGCGYIYKYLAQNHIQSSFASNQVKEEVLKSKIILDSLNNRDVIFSTEDTNFCKGKIKFPLYCIDFANSQDNFDAKDLSNIQIVVNKYLSGADISNDFRRVLFTIKDNKFYNYWISSWLYAVNAPKRCMVENIAKLRELAYNDFFQEYLKESLIHLKDKSIEQLLENYVFPENMPNWKREIIKKKGLLNFSNKHFFALKEDECCWLIPQSRVANSEEGTKKCKRIK